MKQLREGKADVSINNQSRYRGKLEGMHAVHIGNWYLNITAGRNDLSTSSLLLPPYGVTREALRRITPQCLTSPGLAQMRAIDLGLNVQVSGAVDYLERMKQELHPVILNQDRVLGDFMEALYYWTTRFGCRGGFTDMKRSRGSIPYQHSSQNTYIVLPPGIVPADQFGFDWLLSEA